MGKFTNTCAGCLRPTDTGFGLVGEAEWLVAGLMQMMPEGQAIAMVERLAQDEYGCDPGCVPPIDMEVIVRACAGCAGETFELGLLANVEPGPPSYRQPDESRFRMGPAQTA